jgi:putative oxidoreductase
MLGARVIHTLPATCYDASSICPWREAKMIDTAKAPYAALLLRVSMGALFILHGVFLKAMVFGMAGTSGYFASLGLPGWFGWIVMLYETFGGIALILGIYARWVAVFLGIHLLFAAYIGHGSNGWLFLSQGGGYEYPVFWAIGCFTLALLGEGAHAIRPARI